MANDKANKANKANENARLRPGDKDEDGYTAAGSWDIDGWYKIGEGGKTIEGIVRDAKVSWDDETNRATLTYIVELAKPCQGKPIGEDELVEFPAGTILGLGESYGLQVLRDAVNLASDVCFKATPVTKVKLSGKKSLWKWDVRLKGGTRRPHPMNLDTKLAAARAGEAMAEPSDNSPLF